MVKRNIIKIDESLCDGCGSCVIACSEGAIEIVDGKAKVVRESFCDGLGACIGECPKGALTIERREAEAFDEKAAAEHSRQSRALQSANAERAEGHEGESEPKSPCDLPIHRMPGSQMERGEEQGEGPGKHLKRLGPGSQLSSWPVQMRLAHTDAPYFKEASLLIAADCSAFACPMISEFIRRRVVLIGCPKLDPGEPFVSKLTEILSSNDIRDITVLRMEVPCCSHLIGLVEQAIERSGKKIPLDQFICMIDGKVVKDNEMVRR
jgi:NAD-dependent dihydropyrimidine dehydrogenase PreA subunit